MISNWVVPCKKMFDYLSLKEEYEEEKCQMFKGNPSDSCTRLSSMCL